jgi:hypothetical protein
MLAGRKALTNVRKNHRLLKSPQANGYIVPSHEAEETK